jgi:hypothetical protein
MAKTPTQRKVYTKKNISPTFLVGFKANQVDEEADLDGTWVPFCGFEPPEFDLPDMVLLGSKIARKPKTHIRPN